MKDNLGTLIRQAYVLKIYVDYNHRHHRNSISVSFENAKFRRFASLVFDPNKVILTTEYCNVDSFCYLNNIYVKAIQQL
jgi:hypothetical protein